MKNHIAHLGFLSTLAMIFSYVESCIPFPLWIPGFKLGLANLVILLTLYLWNERSAILVSFVRILLMALLFGNLYSFAFSLAGGTLSISAMILAKKTKAFSIAGVSIVGGTFHNLGQFFTALFLMNNINIIYYLPALLIIGAVLGLLLGLLAGFFKDHLPKTNLLFIV